MGLNRFSRAMYQIKRKSALMGLIR